MKKIFGIIGVILLANILWMGKAQNVPITLKEPMHMAMQATGAEVDELHLEGWAILPFEQDELGWQLEMIKYLFKEYGIAENQYELKTMYDPLKRDISAKGASDKYEVSILVRQPNFSERQPAKANLTIKVVEKMPQEDKILEQKLFLQKRIEKFRATPLITTCLKGHLDGKLRNDEWTQRLQDGFDSIGARILERTEVERYHSYAGFVSGIKETVFAGKDKINVHMAMRYNEYKKCTEVIVGSPIISIEY